jgi:class 3 adenylate cyclase
VDTAEPKGLSVRVGMHTGECEMVDADVHGIAVHVGARIAELAPRTDPGLEHGS